MVVRMREGGSEKGREGVRKGGRERGRKEREGVGIKENLKGG